MKKYLFSFGFTLIEVMVVLGIIGILASVVFSNFNDARVDAKNKAFASELKEVQLAIELYKAQKGQYPPAQSMGPSGCFASASVFNLADSNFCLTSPVISGLVPNFIAELPDPRDSANPGSCRLFYHVATDASWYKLIAQGCLGGIANAAEGVQVGDPLARCAVTCSGGTYISCVQTTEAYYTSYAIYSDGGECM